MPIDGKYDSGQGFCTSIWSGPLWHVLHTISFNYKVHPSPGDKRHYYRFMQSLGNVLPCGACRRNYRKNLREMGFSMDRDLKSRNTFSRFVYRLHRRVQRMTTPSPAPAWQRDLPPFEAVRETYECFRATSCGTGGAGGVKEKGCTEPRNQVKSRMLMRVVPVTRGARVPGFRVDGECQISARSQQ